MNKVNLITGLLVLVATLSGVNFIANRVSFLDVSQTVDTVKSKFAAKEYSASSVGFLQEFSVDCLTTATKVAPPEGSSASIACKCAGDVSWGSEDVTASGYESADWGGNVREAYCIAGSTTNCKCISLVSTR